MTRIERFQLGDFPMVCVRSGRPATKLVPVQAERVSAWPWFLFPGLMFVLASWVRNNGHPWGELPFADGEVRSMKVTYDKAVGVIIAGAHPGFVAATRASQGKIPG